MECNYHKEKNVFSNRKNIMEADNFIIVNPKNKKQKRLYFKANTLCNVKSEPKSNETDDINLSIKNLEKWICRFQNNISHLFINDVIDNLNCIIGHRKIIRIRSIGLGNFSSDVSSADQFVLLQAIRNFFHTDLILFQDPRTSPTENFFLKSYKFQVLPSDNLLKQPIDSYSNFNGITLLYMIHCEHLMYDSVLSSYWNLDLLKNLIIIGNNMHSVVDGLSSKNLAKLPVLREFSSLCTCVNLNSDNYSFYSTAISYIPMDVNNLKIDFTDYVPNYEL